MATTAAKKQRKTSPHHDPHISGTQNNDADDHDREISSAPPSAAAATLSSSSTTVIDNPCWGSPTQCSLSDLIQAFPRESSILLETPDYVVLNKPPDLRMDGATYPATVQKLLSYWYYPPASLAIMENDHDEQQQQQLLSTATSNRTASANAMQNNKQPGKNNEIMLRHCHQLDYATSGCLLFAKSKPAAAAAMEAFRMRKVKKSYLAMVHGHVMVPVPDATTTTRKERYSCWPILPRDALHLLEKQEDAYRRRKAKKRSDTYDGYLPPHSVFQKWKVHYTKRQRQHELLQGKSCKRPKQRAENDYSVNLEELWKQVLLAADHRQAQLTDEELEKQLAKSSWKQVKCNAQWKQLMEDLSKLYNDVQRNQLQSSTNVTTSTTTTSASSAGDDNDLPLIFRIQGEANNAFYIFAPLAEVEDDFAMRVKPGTLSHTSASAAALFEGPPNLDYKPALTRCVILDHVVSNKQHPTTTTTTTISSSAKDDGHEPHADATASMMTKMRLEPWTGRRHQLRMHMLLLDTAIVGDATYDAYHGRHAAARRKQHSRMCLHAQSLSLPVLHGRHLIVNAPDPFPSDFV